MKRNPLVTVTWDGRMLIDVNKLIRSEKTQATLKALQEKLKKN